MSCDASHDSEAGAEVLQGTGKCLAETGECVCVCVCVCVWEGGFTQLSAFWCT